MDINAYQDWVSKFYKQRQWYDYDSFVRTVFLAEEVGELARAVRAIEIGRDRPDENEADHQAKITNLREEMGDVLDNLLILADKYGFDMAEIIAEHQQKFLQRYGSNQE